ncbi:MAG: nucleotidyltransferase domain-containing protein, partial [Candidatus Delongbacteria bacterium]
MKKFEVHAKTDCELLDKIKEIFDFKNNKFDEKKIQIFVHGSWADNTRTSFSDLDDLVIIEDSYYKKAKKTLEELELEFQKIDPLQHHGHWLIKKSDLINYDNSYMPLFIINNAISLVGSNKIKANIDIVKSFKGTLNRIKGTCRNIEHFYSLYKQQKLNIYELKMFVGSVALIPPMLFQLKGKEIDKRNAISMAGDLFSGPTAKLIDWATDLRKNWKDLLDDENYIKFKNKVHSFNKAKKWRSYAKCNAPVLNSSKISEIKLSDDLVDNFINETLRHVDRAMYKTVDLDFYEKTYKKVESIAIENGAVLVGRFGSINHPSISDLDMMICFNDRDY